MSKVNDLSAFIAKRDALFRNPTLEAATAHYVKSGLPLSFHPTVPLAMVHKARLQWIEATDAMLAESKAWLKEHGYQATLRGGAPLTPASRDLQRIQRGMAPLRRAGRSAR